MKINEILQEMGPPTLSIPKKAQKELMAIVNTIDAKAKVKNIDSEDGYLASAVDGKAMIDAFKAAGYKLENLGSGSNRTKYVGFSSKDDDGAISFDFRPGKGLHADEDFAIPSDKCVIQFYA